MTRRLPAKTSCPSSSMPWKIFVRSERSQTPCGKYSENISSLIDKFTACGLAALQQLKDIGAMRMILKVEIHRHPAHAAADHASRQRFSIQRQQQDLVLAFFRDIQQSLY